jgi:autotransporter-associated beta strand protein
MNNRPANSLRFLPAALGLAVCLLAGNAKAQSYFDVNNATAGSGVASAGSYSWEDPNWSTSPSGNAGTINWFGGGLEGTAIRFAAGTDAAANNYTVTANADHLFAGMFLQADGGGAVTLNGSGVLSLVSGIQGFQINGSAQSLVVNSVLGGAGGIQTGLNGSLYLYGNNNYGGGTVLGSSAALYFNNGNSFGTGPIGWGTAQPTTSATVLATPAATAPMTIANHVVANAGTQIFLGVAVAPVTFSGSWALPAAGTTTFQIDTAGTKVTISGAIGGLAAFNKTGAGTLVLSGANNYTGPTIITAGTLQLGAANTIGSSSSIVMNGGTMDLHSFNQIISSTTLTLAANSTIDFSAGGSHLELGNSSAAAWTAGTVLNLLHWDPSTFDVLRIGTDATGLTPAQLSQIEFDGAGLGMAQIDRFGVVSIPEPSTALLGLLGGLGVLWIVRRRAA